jgi:V/A-type H+-transporting ATPase subunit A
MEEIPGDEAYPAYLDSAIRAVYERAGVVQGGPERTGSLTMIGTVSPAGGNFDEPVTQSTLNAVRVFLALSAERAYRRAFPAIEPLQSWSRYPAALAGWFAAQCGTDWASLVQGAQRLLREGDAIAQMIEVAGEEGVSLEEYRTWHAARLIDEVFLQQDTTDKVDAHVPLQRMAALLRLVMGLVERPGVAADRAGVRETFTRWAATLRQLNYSEFESDDYRRYAAELGAPSTG